MYANPDPAGNRALDDLPAAPGSAAVDDHHTTAATFEPEAMSARAARQFTETALRTWGREDRVADVALIVSELAANAVLHARTAFRVTIDASASAVRIEVHDRSPDLPVLTTPSASTSSGRGLLIVAGVATDWGFETEPGGKVVWARLA